MYKIDSLLDSLSLKARVHFGKTGIKEVDYMEFDIVSYDGGNTFHLSDMTDYGMKSAK